MLFSEHIAMQKEFEASASMIGNIFVDARAIPGYDNYFDCNKRMPRFHFERIRLNESDPSKANIHLSCWIGDRQEWDIITIPLEFIDNFNAETIKAYAEGLRRAEEQAKATAAADAAKKAEDEKRATLAKLMKQFPEMVPGQSA
jgi:hypothetical protein